MQFNNIFKNHFNKIAYFLVIYLTTFFATFASNVAAAFCYDDCETTNALYESVTGPPLNYFMGFNYFQMSVPPKHEVWKNSFVKAHPGVGFYFGRRNLCDDYGFEVGYEWTINKPKSFVVQPASRYIGVLNTGRVPVSVNSKVRFKSGYLDLHRYILLPLCDYCGTIKPEIVLSIGVANVRPKMHYVTDPAVFIIPIQGRSNAVLRLGAGFQCFVANNLGFKFMVRWQNTSVLRARGGLAATPAFRNIFHDSWGVSLGLYTMLPQF